MSSQNLGLRKSARNPASIVNNQNNAPSAAQRSLNGIPGTIKEIVAASTTATVLEDYAILWVVNTDTAVQYLFIGDENEAPVTTDSSNGMAIPAGQGVLIHCGQSGSDIESLVTQSSDDKLHISVMLA